jgi:hypothetical protein
VYVRLAYTPLVVRHEGAGLMDQCGRPFRPNQTFLDDEGSVVFSGEGTAALLDDRDLLRYAEEGERLPRILAAEVAARYGFVQDPGP